MKTVCKPLIAIYNKHPTKKGLYELKEPNNFQFDYLVVSPSKANYLKEVAAMAVVNCWNKKSKVLHTGLIMIYENWWYGDNITGRPNKDFILVHYLPVKKELNLYLFQNFYPKKPFEFSRKFVFEYSLTQKAT